MFVITRPGLYPLTENPYALRGEAGARIDSDNVTLDPGGRTLMGCEGSLDGVTVSTLAANLPVREGDVRDWGQDGVDLSNTVGPFVHKLRMYDKGGFGLLLGSGARIVDCTMDRNRGYGGAAWDRD